MVSAEHFFKPRRQPQLLRHFKLLEQHLQELEIGIIKRNLPEHLQGITSSSGLDDVFRQFVVDYLCLLGNADGALSIPEADYIHQIISGDESGATYRKLAEFCQGNSHKYTTVDHVNRLIRFYGEFSEAISYSSFYDSDTHTILLRFLELSGLKMISIDSEIDDAEIAIFSELMSNLNNINNSGIAGGVSNGSDQTNGIEALQSLIGLREVKHEVSKLINLVKIRTMRKDSGLTVPEMSHHLVFSGNPGTGKTTVARLLGRIYADLGLLSKGHLIETDRSALVAGYIGQTAIKTKEVLDKAKGGVLFIDEAYMLKPEGGASDYGQESIDTILKFMEDERGDFILIVAGYTNKMQSFMSSNPGLRSRFNREIIFEDYNDEELFNIFQRFVTSSGYCLDESAKEKVRQYIDEIYLHKPENFGNARDIRNLFERILGNHADRVASMQNTTHSDLSLLLESDIIMST